MNLNDSMTIEKRKFFLLVICVLVFCYLIIYWQSNISNESYVLSRFTVAEGTVAVADDVETRTVLSALDKILTQRMLKTAPEFYESSIQYKGSQRRLHLAIAKAILLQKKTLSVAIIGGSISAAHAIQVSEAYFSHLCKWLSQAFQHANIQVVCENFASGAISSNYFALCVEEYFEISKYDLFLVDFAVNDNALAENGDSTYQPHQGRPLEELVRKLLIQNHQIDIIPIIFPLLYKLPLGTFPGNYCQKMPAIDETYLEIAQHYSLTTIQFRSFLCQSNLTNEGISNTYVSQDDKIHPNSMVHGLMAEFLVDYFRKSITFLIERLSNKSTFMKPFINQEETFVKKETVKMLETTVFSSTMSTEHSDCFVSFDCPFRKNLRLTEALVNSDVALQPREPCWSTAMPSTLEETGARAVSIDLENQPSVVRFNFTKLKAPAKFCGHGSGYFPKISISQPLLTVGEFEKAGALMASAKFHFTDGSDFTADYFLPPQMTYVGHFHEQYLLPKFASRKNQQSPSTKNPRILSKNWAAFCSHDSPSIDYLELAIEQATNSYATRILAVIIDYQCCAIY